MSRAPTTAGEKHQNEDVDQKKTKRKRKGSKEQKNKTNEVNGQQNLKVETEAISNKERRKRRKLEKRKAMGEEDEVDNSKTTETVTSSRKVESIFTTATRSKHGVWVGNLLFTTTARELAQFFQPVGTVTRLHISAGKRPHEANSGFANVDFASAEDVDAALEKCECQLGGRKLLIKRASDYSGRPSATPASADPSNPSLQSAAAPPPTVSKSVRKILDRQKQPPAPCIYFGNLSFETTSEGIVSMLHAHHRAQQAWKPKASNLKSKTKGNDTDEDELDDEEPEKAGGKRKLDSRSAEVGIRKVRMGTFEDSGKCKGFAFVDFETVEQATNVLTNLKNHQLDGRILTVEYASADAVKRGGGSARLIQQKRGYPGPPASTGRMTRDGAPQPRRPRPHPLPSSAPYCPPTPAHIPEPIAPPPPIANEAVRKVKKEFKGRQKPGAALANAQRAPTGIVKNPETVGKKTVFS
ncbi:hypothetical protein PtA15_15A466 [Puccinia triticina]|uniref:RRM domain-containing protein n=1 Tax=Puccinia triticina TaxID=208348 RepID=A0ABY7D5A0_9BASI|nr:uncharacterized protein PtA15_15A466 [Puccinia triticina]WAQ92070.1 hypothetical protein PtA15_15A466 [Puccinia triticina]